MDRRGLNITLEREVDAVCDRFEALLRAGQHPNVDEFLRNASADAVPVLTVELLRLAVEYAGTKPNRPARNQDDDEIASSTDVSAETPTAVSVFNTATAHSENSHASVPASELPAAAGKTRLGTEFGDYELLDELGAGGMGTVYRARQRSVNRIVAIKVLHPHRWSGLSEGQRQRAIERFLQEACAAARHEHPNVITVYDGGSCDGEHYLAMQFVDGQSLAQLVREAPFDNRRAAAYLEPVCRGLHAVHGAGVLHRDLKPSNILIERQSDRPLLTDFGLAKVVDGDRDLTLSGDVFGSPPYMSPEQVVDASHVSVAADVYGLGATLYHLLTGRPPFQAATIAGTLHQVLSTEPVPPRLLNPSVDRDIETICLKCLEKQPRQRYADAIAVARELQRYLAGHPIEARPLNWVGRMSRWCRRRPAVAGLIAALAITLITAFAVVATLYVRERNSAEFAKTTLAENQRQLAQAYRRSANLEQWPPSTSALAWVAACLSIEREADQNYVNRIRLRRLLETCPRLIQQIDHSAAINCAIFSPDGQSLLTAGADGRAQLWATDGSSASILELRHSEQSAILAACFSPDGSIIATGCKDGSARLWDAATSQSVGAPLMHQGPILSVSFSHDGRWLATGSADRSARLWDTATGQPVTDPLVCSGIVLSVAFAPGHDRLATAASDGSLVMWPIPSGKPAIQKNRGKSPVSRIAFDQRGSRLLAASSTGGAQVWATESLSEPVHTIATDGRVVAARIAENADVAMVATASGQILHWQIQPADAPVAEFRADAGVRRAEMSSDGKMIAVAVSNKSIDAWTRDTAGSIAQVANISNGEGASHLCFAPDSKTLLTAHGSRARLWAMPRSDVVQQLAGTNISGAWYAPQSGHFVASQSEQELCIFKVDGDGRATQSVRHDSPPIFPAGSVCGSHFVVAERGGTVTIVDLAAAAAQAIDCTDLAPLTLVAATADSSFIAVVGRENRLRIINSRDNAATAELALSDRPFWLGMVATGKQVIAVCSDRVLCVSAAGDSKHLTEEVIQQARVPLRSKTEDGSIVLLDSDLGVLRIGSGPFATPTTSLAHLPQMPYGLWPNHDGKLCAAATAERGVRVFDAMEGQARSSIMRHAGKVLSAGFSASNLLFTTICEDRMLRVWEISSTSLVCQAPCPDSSPIGTWFGDDDQFLLALFKDGRLLTVELRPDVRPQVALERDARLISGQRIDHVGSLVPVSIGELDDDWTNRAAAQ